MRKHLVTGGLGLAALILNPFYACSMIEGYSYGAKDMRAAVEGTWTLTTERRSYTFQVKQGKHDPKRHSSRSMISSAHACGTRTLVASASACIDESLMPVVVTLEGTTTDGVFAVFGTTFTEGTLRIDVAGQNVDATVTPDGKATLESGKLIRIGR